MWYYAFYEFRLEVILFAYLTVFAHKMVKFHWKTLITYILPDIYPHIYLITNLR